MNTLVKNFLVSVRKNIIASLSIAVILFGCNTSLIVLIIIYNHFNFLYYV